MSRLLKEALELNPTGQRRWLESLAAEYHDLLPALKRALLPRSPRPSGSTRTVTLPDVCAPRIDSVGSGLRPAQAVGPYRLIRPLGAGGMAEVWLAQRADGAFKRKVALKLPTLSRHRKDLTARFERERDILAALEHPNIARFYDGGLSAEGLPYLAMEYVRGEPLTDWCDEHRLGLRERLKLFLQVLDAVQYAHQRQVIHRDIKPWNILVTYWSQVRLLDFGVARLLARDEEETDITERFGRALTPEYASPEHMRGDAIGTAADVYSLGVVLYELLCGSRPYGLQPGVSMTMIEQAVATGCVEPPSARVTPGAAADRSMAADRLGRRLRGDLDAIALKALSKAPVDRYASAATLGDDLRRYLSARPVRARPDRLSYRLSKLVQRHRTTTTVAAASALLVVAMGYALIQRDVWFGPQTQSATNTADLGGGESGTPAVVASEAHPQPPNVEAYNLLLQGNYILSRHTKPDVETAIGYYRDAIRLEPNYALAWTKLATADITLAANGWIPSEEGAERARSALQRAIGIDPNLAVAHRKLGELYAFFDRDFAQAQAQYEQARTLDPGDPKILSSMAALEAGRLGEVEVAVALLREALQRDPLETSALSSLSWILFCGGHLEESVTANNQLLELNPSYAGAHAYLSLTLMAMGRYEAALHVAKKEPDEGYRLHALPVIYWAMQHRAESDQALHELEQKHAVDSAYNIAEAHAYRGEADVALEWLERAYQQRDAGMMFLKVDPLLRNLRDDRRFQAMLAGMQR